MKRRCARTNCRKKVKYTSPADLCSKHWKMWWDYGLKGKEKGWLRAIDDAIQFRQLMHLLATTDTE